MKKGERYKGLRKKNLWWILKEIKIRKEIPPCKIILQDLREVFLYLPEGNLFLMMFLLQNAISFLIMRDLNLNLLQIRKQ